MKKIVLSACAIVLATIGFSQTAVNFNLNDCQGNNHDLYTELDAGKVVVITWVMPCSACIGVASSVANTVQGYATSDPGRVVFYLVDDYANTACNTLTSWASTNSITTDAIFSNTGISMTDYGTAGMQKTVILGGTSHMVFYNQVGAVTVSTMQTAINNALLTGIAVNPSIIGGMDLFPNPVNGNASTLNYSLTQNSDVNIDIYNTLGEKVKSVTIAKQTIGKHESAIDLTGFSNGTYIIKLTAGESSQTTKFVVAN